MRRIILSALIGLLTVAAVAQRTTDVMDRGLVALQPSTWSNSVTLTWRVLATEYYGVTYNVYRDGVKVNAAPLSVSYFQDSAGSPTASYTVRPVRNGVEGPDSKAVTPWEKGKQYKEITMDHGSLTSQFEPNDACCADVDGDGEVEIILKFFNRSDGANAYKPEGHNGEYAIAEVYKLDGTKLWWLDFGPNMADFQNNENNIVAYDWDMDGKAEALMRAADGTVIHAADGCEYVIGDRTQNYRNASGYEGQWFICFGREYLVYMDGATGVPYQVIDYPLPRLEESEWATLTTKCAYNDYPTLWKNQGNYGTKTTGVLHKAWGDNYGHRSSKHFFGAPYLDGRRPSIFLGRGIYTRHKFVTLDVDPATHKLTERWRWNCNNSKSEWYGNGYHNYIIADVDWDGRDEIVFGSMVIDDNGHGLSTTGYGHGDAIHVSDLDPYNHGQEVFACLEEGPVYGNNLRDATTSKVYYKYNAKEDEGRCLMANLSNAYPGSIGVSSTSGVISSVTHDVLSGVQRNGIADNFRIYWDGDILSETFNYIKFNTEPVREDTGVQILKFGKGAIKSWTDVHTNNDTKGTPCYQGDILGDWREELILRTPAGNIRIYTTTDATTYRIPSLWEDHQYRQAMVWQMCGYNQPPHVSYFMGALEGFTMTPPPLTMNGRTEVEDGGSISGDTDDELIVCGYGDKTVSVAAGAAPAVLYVNAPSWVQGTDVDGTSDMYPTINRTYYTHTLTGAGFGGDMRLVKQGDGTLNLPAVEQTYTGNTDIWAGKVNFNGTLTASRVWMNRFAELNSAGSFGRSIEMCYASVLRPGGADNKGTMTIADTLVLNYGARVVMDIYGADFSSDQINTRVLKIDKKTFRNGPQYLTPVVELSVHYAPGAEKLPQGRYLLFDVEKVEGSLADIVIEGLTSQKCGLISEGGKIYLDVNDMRSAELATWTGAKGDVWDYALTQNFKTTDAAEDVFVTGDKVLFDDNAKNASSGKATVTVAGAVRPSTVTFNNSTVTYTVDGEGDITGNVDIVKSGTGTVNINNVNSFEGTISVSGGSLLASSLANRAGGVAKGSLGVVDNVIKLSQGGAIGVNADAVNGHPIALGTGGGSIDVAAGKTFELENAVTSETGASLYKIGTGTLVLRGGNKLGRFYLQKGQLVIPSDEGDAFTGVVELASGTRLTQKHYAEVTLTEEDQEAGVEPVIPQTSDRTKLFVADGGSVSFYLDGNCDYEGTLGGEGRLSLYPQGTANNLKGDWSAFSGTVSVAAAGSSWVGLKDGFRLDGASLDVSAGATVTADGEVTLGVVAGGGTLAGDGTYRIGSAGTDFSFSGNITSNVVKEGAGRWTISSSKPQPEVPAVTVNGGELYLNSSFALTTAFFSAATVTVNDGATLMGNGTVNSIVLGSGAELTPGMTPKVGPLGATGSLTAESGSVINLNLANSQGTIRSLSYITAGGAMTLNGTVNVTLNDGFVPAGGSEFTLWQGAAFAGTPTVNLPELPEGLSWDTTQLMAPTGVLKVVGATAIHNVGENGVARYQLFNTAGVLVAEFEATPQTAQAVARRLPLSRGTYVVRQAGGGTVQTVKILVR